MGHNTFIKLLKKYNKLIRQLIKKFILKYLQINPKIFMNMLNNMFKEYTNDKLDKQEVLEYVSKLLYGFRIMK